MITFNVTITIERPVDEVFEFLANFENMPRWNYYVMRVDKISSGVVGVGTRFHQVRKNDQQDYEITQLAPPRLIEMATRDFSPSLTMRFELQDVGSATRLIDTWTLQSRYPQFLESLVPRRLLARALTANLGKLKQLLETGSTQLQDGRISHVA